MDISQVNRKNENRVKHQKSPSGPDKMIKMTANLAQNNHGYRKHRELTVPQVNFLNSN